MINLLEISQSVIHVQSNAKYLAFVSAVEIKSHLEFECFLRSCQIPAHSHLSYHSLDHQYKRAYNMYTLHSSTGSFSSIYLPSCHPTLYLYFNWFVCKDQHHSDHFPIIIDK